MNNHDSKWLHKVNSNIIEIHTKDTPYPLYGFVDYMNRLIPDLKRFSGGGIIKGGVFERTQDKNVFCWVNDKGKKIIVDRNKEVDLNYQLEHSCFSSQVTTNPVEIRKVTVADLEKAISANKWRRAKTINPHEYVVRKNWVDVGVTWIEFLNFIYNNHRLEYLYCRQYRVFDIGEYKYWIMGNAEHITIILNRAKREWYDGNNPNLRQVR